MTCYWHAKGCNRPATVEIIEYESTQSDQPPKHFSFCSGHADNFERSCDLLIDRPRILRLDLNCSDTEGRASSPNALPTPASEPSPSAADLLERPRVEGGE